MRSAHPLAASATKAPSALGLKWRTFGPMLDAVEAPAKRELLVAYTSIHGFNTKLVAHEFIHLLFDEILIYCSHTIE